MSDLVLDAHAHCGLSVPYEDLARAWEAGSVQGGVVFSPVEEIYDRGDPHFKDSDNYRKSRPWVHRYLRGIASRQHIFPYFFVWNDFPEIPEGFYGIKWHRHPGEPVYDYGTPECEAFIEEVLRRRLPVVLEEEFANTLDFIRKIAGRTTVIIPHMGCMNGGYARLKRIGAFDSPMVWVDTALASPRDIEDFAATHGTERIVFGSDYPSGIPARERATVEAVFSGEDLTAVLSGNLLRLLKRPVGLLSQALGAPSR